LRLRVARLAVVVAAAFFSFAVPRLAGAFFYYIAKQLFDNFNQ
jgi:hypothetical protein